MLQIKNLIFLILLSIFLSPVDFFAQEHNQFDENNKRTGVWRKYYNNKRIRYIGQFKDGKEIGTFKFYDITSSKHPTAIKKFSENSDSAYVEYFTVNGVLRSKGSMLSKNRVGKWMYFFPTGKVFSEEYYQKGKLEGEVKNYYKTGVLFEVSQYKDGLRNGLLKRYSDKGVLIESAMNKNGKLNGKSKYFELNGNLKEEGVYKDNKRVGKWEFYIGGVVVDEKKKKEANKFDKSILQKNDSVKKNK